jgi:hypothetical protein
MHRKLESLVLFIMEVLIRIMDKKSYISFGFIWVSIKQKFCLYKDLIKFFLLITIICIGLELHMLIRLNFISLQRGSYNYCK